MTTPQSVTVRVSRDFTQSPDRVFNAWLDPLLAKRFLFATPDGQMVRADVDARVGGKFNFTDRRGGEDIEHVGEYVKIDRPRQLVFTFGVPKFSNLMTTVTIDIEPLPTGCRLTLTHVGVLEEWAGKTNDGWAMILETLSKAAGGDTVRVSRRYKASPERVFDAWLDVERARQFLYASPGESVLRAEIDPRVGGKFHFVTRHQGKALDLVGEYLVIDRPRRLMFSLAVPELAPDVSTVTVEIVPTEDGCELTLSDEGVTPNWVKDATDGWTMFLETLVRVLETTS